jgi:hypothetical protein
LTEDLFGNSLLIEGGQGNVMFFGDGIESLEIISIFVRIQSLDQSIENSIPDAECLHTSIDSGLSRQGGLAVDASLQAALARLVGIGAAGARASYPPLLTAIAAHQRSPS